VRTAIKQERDEHHSGDGEDDPEIEEGVDEDRGMESHGCSLAVVVSPSTIAVARVTPLNEP
jgi:hypothetical protein